MTLALQPYPAYKHSGVEWLRQIPAHWQCLPHRALFSEVIERDCPNEPMLSVTISKGIIRQADLLENSAKKDSSNENKASYKLVKPGDIAYNKMRAWQGAIGVSTYKGIISPAYIVVRPRLAWTQQGGNSLNTNYFHYLLRTPAFAKEAERWSYGITSDQWSLRSDDFKRIYNVLPPREEQDCIVRFLEYTDRRVNRLIRIKRRLIELLNEQKQAVIHSTITQGLDPDAPQKPSGVDGLGDIPAHWTTPALWMRYSIQLGKMLDAKRITGRYLVPYLRNTDVQWGRINTKDLPAMDILPEEYERYTVRPGDLLVCEGGEVGRCAFWEGAIDLCGYQKALHRVRPLKPLEENTYFLAYVLNNTAKAGLFLANGAENTIAHLTAEKLRAYRFAFPLKSEQDQIVAYLNKTLETIQISINSTQREIELIREYRIRLIADVVTGKIDVRGFVPVSETAAEWETIGEEINTDDEADAEAIDGEAAQNYA